MIFSPNASRSHKNIAQGIFQIPIKEYLGKYLGCPTIERMKKNPLFSSIIDRANQKLSNWKANMLSKAGRTVLIQSDIESMPAHTIQYF